MTFLDFGTYAIRKCCDGLEFDLKHYFDDYWLENEKLMVCMDYGDEVSYTEFELEYCYSCDKPIIYYQTIGMLERNKNVRRHS